MPNKMHGKVMNKRFVKMAALMLIFVLLSGMILPEFTAFAEDDAAKEAPVTGLASSEQVEDEATGSKEAKEETKTYEAESQVEDEINKDAEKAEEKNEESLSAEDQVVDVEIEEDESFQEEGLFEAEIKGYKVSVEADEDAFDEKVKLQVKEVLLPGEKVKDSANEKEDVQKMTKETVEVLKDSNLYSDKNNAVDISFINSTGEKVEPETEVKVELAVDKDFLKEEIDERFLRLDHVIEDKEGEPKETEMLVLGSMENEKENTVEYKKKDDQYVFAFSTESFSVYQIGGNPINVNFVTAVYKENAEGQSELYGYDGSLTDQMTEWKGTSSYGSIRFVDDKHAPARYQNNAGEWKLMNIDKTRYTWKIAYIVPKVSSDYDWSEGKFGKYIKDNGVEISEIRYYNGKWQYYQRNMTGNAGWKDVPTDRSYEIYSIYEDNEREVTPAKEVPTVDSTSKGLHMYMIDYKGGHNGDWGDSNGLFYIANEYVSTGKRGQTIQGLYSNQTNASGYPTLVNRSMNIYGQGAVTDAQRDMRNWFDPEAAKSNPLVTSIKEANHLFRLSDYENNGYFFYDSALNAAYMPNGNNNDPGDFKVYDQLVTAARNNNYASTFFYRRGMFTPYNGIPKSQNPGWVQIKNDYDASGKAWTEYTDADYNAMYNGKEYKENVGKDILYADGARVGANYHFGMYMYCDFFQPINGQVSHKGYDPEDMVYEFTGDDDMLVYIDGVLVLDLGGVHDAESGKINFRTGEVDYTMNYNNGNTHPVYVNKKTTIRSMYEKAGAAEGVEWKGNTFEAGTAHRIQIFYMERGAAASNLKIKLNIPPVPDGAVALTKAVEKLPGQVALNNEADEGTPKEYFLMHVQIQKPGETTWTDIPAGTEYTVAGRTWAVRKDGYLLLLDRETAIFNFSGEDYTKTINGQEVKTKIRVKEVTSSKLAKSEIDDENFSVIEANPNYDAQKIYDVNYTETKIKSGEVIDDSNSTEVTNMEGQGVSIDPAKINMVTVHNKPASLKIRKEVENAINGDANKEFDFDVKLSGINLEETKFQAIRTKANGSKENFWITFTKDGSDYKARIKLKKDEEVHILNLPKTATYSAVEVGEPQGFVVLKDDNISGSLNANNEAKDVTTTVNNFRPALYKVDSDTKEPVAGAKFELHRTYWAEGYKQYQDLGGDQIPSFTSDENGNLVLPILYSASGTFLLFETEAPGGYEPDKAPWLVKINNKGEITLSKYNGPYASKRDMTHPDTIRDGYYYWSPGNFKEIEGEGDAKLYVENTRLPGELTKVDQSGNPLAGAQFEMFKLVEVGSNKVKKGQSVGLTSVSDSEGKFSLPTSRTGGYLMFEVKTPDGYVPQKAPWWVNLYSNGSIAVYSYDDPFDEGPEWNRSAGNVDECGFCGNDIGDIVNIQYEALTKVNEISGAGRKTLQGAEFDLYMAQEGDELYSVANGENNGGKKLNATPIVSDASGKVRLPIPEPGKKYLLFETKAPEGYERAKSPWLVKANTNGTLTLWKSTQDDKAVNSRGEVIDAGDSVVTFERWWKKSWFDNNEVTSKDLVNKGTPIELEKVNEDKSLTLPGAEFMICRIDMSGTDYFVEGTRQDDGAAAAVTVEDKAILGVDGVEENGKTVTSDQNGKITIHGLGAGSYFLFEHKAPAGYALAKSPWLITVTEANGIRTWNVKAIDPRFYGKYIAHGALHDFDGKSLYNRWWNKRGSVAGVTNTDWYATQPVTTELVNEPLYQLPKAGGIGTHLFTFFGTLIAVIAAVLMFARKEEVE